MDNPYDISVLVPALEDKHVVLCELYNSTQGKKRLGVTASRTHVRTRVIRANVQTQTATSSRSHCAGRAGSGVIVEPKHQHGHCNSADGQTCMSTKHHEVGWNKSGTPAENACAG